MRQTTCSFGDGEKSAERDKEGNGRQVGDEANACLQCSNRERRASTIASINFISHQPSKDGAATSKAAHEIIRIELTTLSATRG